MAILPGVPGITVTVQSFEQDLPEYKDEGDWTYMKFGHLPEAKRISTYVQCQTEAEFRIRIQVQYPFRMDSQSLTFKARVDGHGIAQTSCTAECFQRASGMYMEVITSKIERLSAMNISARTLRFSSIKKVDDHDSVRVKKDAKLVSDIGEIVVSVFRTMPRPALPIPGNFTPSRYVPPTEVAEKALKGKAISHGVSYGQQQVIQRVTRETTDIDGSDNPIAVFIFKYRSRDDLKSELIIPRSPSPEPVRRLFQARNRNIPEDRDAREAKLKALKMEMAEIKAEDEERPQSKKRGLGADAPQDGRAYKISKGPNGSVVIDLTDD